MADRARQGLERSVALEAASQLGQEPRFEDIEVADPACGIGQTRGCPVEGLPDRIDFAQPEESQGSPKPSDRDPELMRAFRGIRGQDWLDVCAGMRDTGRQNLRGRNARPLANSETEVEAGASSPILKEFASLPMVTWSCYTILSFCKINEAQFRL